MEQRRNSASSECAMLEAEKKLSLIFDSPIPASFIKGDFRCISRTVLDCKEPAVRWPRQRGYPMYDLDNTAVLILAYHLCTAQNVFTLVNAPQKRQKCRMLGDLLACALHSDFLPPKMREHMTLTMLLRQGEARVYNLKQERYLALACSSLVWP